MTLGNNTTIYSGWGWDEAVATAALAIALLRKGFKVYIEFPSPSERKKLLISRSYAVGISHKDGAIITDSIALTYVPERRLGVVMKYDGNGNGDVMMRFSNVNSLTESVLEYIQTLNEDVEIPEQLLKDITLINSGNFEKLSKTGKAMMKALKMNYMSKDFRKVMYLFALDSIKSKSVKLTEDLVREAEKYDKAMELAQQVIERREYIPYGKLKVLVISSKISRDFIKQNYALLRPIAYDLLVKVCRNDGVAILVQETDLGHVIRVCLRSVDVSFVKVIAAIPKDLSEKLIIDLRGNHLVIKFKKPEESTLDKALELTDIIATAITSSLEGKKSERRS